VTRFTARRRTRRLWRRLFRWAASASRSLLGVVFIASDEASFITSHVLNVDGGKTG
jgi:hypothetical protein